ncbi:aldose epimerase family protein [Flagellimonas sp. MMG031]|uniref:Aldose 1-epimerase n=1 Tax=Flagellimonas sp. MMG031 TaxID=3158549 RepID=A0AAU7MWT6_9FLAO
MANQDVMTVSGMFQGREVRKYTLANKNGMEVDVLNYGGIISRWTAPDKQGKFENVVLSFDDPMQYLTENPFLGALIGRYGNRIANGQFTLDGNTFTLCKNHGKHHLHGGFKGFDKVFWDISVLDTSKGTALELSYTSPHGEEGYPGKLQVTVTYTLLDTNELDVRYLAKTDRPTIVNLTQHSYFNLSGNLCSPVLDHEIFLNADSFLPVDDELVPTGELRDVCGTPFDFRKPKLIGKDIEKHHEQLSFGNGYDHCWSLNTAENKFQLAASAYHGKSGRFLQVYTSEPGIQFYSGNFLDVKLPGKSESSYSNRCGFCLETQHFPDTPNHTHFPTVTLKPEETYFSRTLFKLSSH